MIISTGPSFRLCDGLTRRRFLQVGGLGMFGLGLGDLFRLQARPAAAARAPRFGQAKSCILIHLFGAHPQHETFDPKLEAPREYRSLFGAVQTRLPGVLFGSHFPRLARLAQQLWLDQRRRMLLPRRPAGRPAHQSGGQPRQHASADSVCARTSTPT